jgi:TetR/AcrR family hemagglutinin/protease transcriptional regulator
MPAAGPDESAPPRRAKRRRLTREARQAQLLSCALEVFAREGVSRASHQDVAREAGISTPTVFFYFPTRRDLVDAVLSSVERFMMDVIQSAPEDLAPGAALLRMGEAFIKGAPEDLLKIKIWLEWSTSFRDDIWPRFLALQRTILSHEQSLIERGQRDGTVPPGVRAEDAARIVHGNAHMLALMMFEQNDPDRIRHFMKRLIETALTPPSAT